MSYLKFSYQDKKTPIHKLNPVITTVWVASVVILALLLDHPVFLALLFISTIPVVFAAKIHREWAIFVKLAFYLGIVIVIINSLASNSGSNILWQPGIHLPLLGEMVITMEALFYGFVMVIRLLAIISAFSIFTFTVHPDNMLMVMLKFKLPYRSAMMTALSTRFVPTLIEDAMRIKDAQQARGLDFDKGNIYERIKKRASIFTSLLSSSLERTIQIAESMEARAFGSCKQRTYFHQTRLDGVDRILLISHILILAVAIFSSIKGFIYFQFYPELNGFVLPVAGWIIIAAILILLLSITPLALLKKRAVN